MTHRLRRQPPIVLSWAPHAGAAAYRVIVRDTTTDEVVNKLEVDGFSASLEARELNPDHRYEWRVQALSSRFGDWEDVLPYLRLFHPAEQKRAVQHLSWPASEEPSRFLLRDDATGRIVLKEGLLGDVYPLERELLVKERPYSYSVQSWRDGSWITKLDFQPLPAPSSPVARASTQLVEPQASAPHLFLWTCDTEVNMRYLRDPDPARGVDHQVFCLDGDGHAYGIEYMMDLLEGFGMRGTFFVDILMEYQFGRSDLERVVDAIASRDHDIQLHLHPSPNLLLSGEAELATLAPALTADDPDLFRRALDLSVRLFEDRVGRAPVAFRAGAYHLCDAFLDVLPEFGIRVDSSLNPFKNCRVSDWMRTRTQPFWPRDDLLEVPVGWLLYDNSAGRHHQQVAPTKSGRQQDAFALFDHPESSRPATLVYLAHSFSLLSVTRKFDDEQIRRWNEAYEAHCPPGVQRSLRMGEGRELLEMHPPADTDRIALMSRLLEAVAGRDDIRACTFAELVDEGLDRWPEERVSPIDPVPLWHERAATASIAGTRVYTAGYLSELERRSAAVTTRV